ncbi:MAG: alcohol dehydrogenase catalytic domain-containing protein [Nitrososphaeraceae archaeon]
MKFLAMDRQLKRKRVYLKDIEMKNIKNDEVLIKLEACGLCGSDVSNVKINSCKPTDKLGHEVSGIIEKVGKNVKKIKKGERVFVHHHTSCNKCYYCKHGNETMCKKYIDSLEPCGISEKFIVPSWNIKQDSIYKIPTNITMEEAAMIEPLACCLRAWKKIDFNKNNSVAIFGIGPIGILHSMIAKTKYAKKIVGIDKNDYRLKFCQKICPVLTLNIKRDNIHQIIKKETKKRGVDVVIISTSDMSTINEAMDIVRKGGTVLIFGEPKNNIKIKIEPSKIYTKELTITSSYAASTCEIKEALELICTRKIEVEKIITHKFILNDAVKAIKEIEHKKNIIKAIIVPNQTNLQ